MSDRCLLCSLNPQTGAVLCWKHVDALSDLLNPANDGRPSEDIAASIPCLWAKLDPTPGGSGGTDERRAPGFRSTPAGSLHVIAMRDSRSKNDPQVWFDPNPSGIGEDITRPHWEEPNPPRPILASVESLFDQLIEDTDLIGPRLSDGRWFARGTSVQAMCALIHDWLSELLTYHHIDEIYLDLLELSDQLRRAVGDAPLGPSGWCIELVRDRHAYGYRYCGGPLHLLPPEKDPPVPPDQTAAEERKAKEEAQRKEVARCPRCHRRYSWLDLIRIRYIETPDADTA